jgi:hypothetical protein
MCLAQPDIFVFPECDVKEYKKWVCIRPAFHVSSFSGRNQNFNFWGVTPINFQAHSVSSRLDLNYSFSVVSDPANLVSINKNGVITHPVLP